MFEKAKNKPERGREMAQFFRKSNVAWRGIRHILVKCTNDNNH